MKKILHILLFIILSQSWLLGCLTIKDKEQINSELREYISYVKNLDWDLENFISLIEKISQATDCLIWVKGTENSYKQTAESIEKTFKRLIELKDLPQGELWEELVKSQSEEAFSRDEFNRFYKSYQIINYVSVDFIVKTRDSKVYAIARFSRLDKLNIPDLLLPIYIKTPQNPLIFEKLSDDFDMDKFEIISSLQELLMNTREDVYVGLLEILSKNFSER